MLIITVDVYALTQINVEQIAPDTAESFFKSTAMISAAVAFSISTLAAGIAIAAAGSAAMSASAERPEIRSLGIIICGLAESLGIYGLIVALQLIGKI